MKSKDIIIVAVIIILTSLLSGCSLIEKAEPTTDTTATSGAVVGTPDLASDKMKRKKPGIPKLDVEKLVQKAAAARKEVKVNLTGERSNGEVKVKITLDNPNQKPITSVQSWLSFDASKLYGKTIDTSKSAFSLMAPYDNTFDHESGLVMLGRANQDPITSRTIEVAEVTFDVIGEGTIMIDAYDYRENLTGHISVNTMIDGEPHNILIKPDSPALIIEN